MVNLYLIQFSKRENNRTSIIYNDVVTAHSDDEARKKADERLPEIEGAQKYDLWRQV